MQLWLASLSPQPTAEEDTLPFRVGSVSTFRNHSFFDDCAWPCLNHTSLLRHHGFDLSSVQAVVKDADEGVATMAQNLERIGLIIANACLTFSDSRNYALPANGYSICPLYVGTNTLAHPDSALFAK